MPDRRIDAIGKTNATGWKSTQLPKGSPNQVRVISGLLSNATTGSVMHAMVQKAANDAFKVSLNGESFLIKGLPASLAGKEVAFIVQKSTTQANAKAELFWIGASKSAISAKQTHLTQSTQPGQQANVKTAAPASNMAHFRLAAGETTPAFVQQRLSNGLVQLNILGTSVETPAPASVNKGDVLMLKMNKPPSDFQLLSAHKNASAKALSTLKANISSSNTPIAQNISSMRNLLPALPVNDLAQIKGLPQLGAALKNSEITMQQPLNGERLMQMMRNAGSGLESKLLQLSQSPALSSAIQHDLKSIMLQLTNQQGSHAQQTELIKTLTELGQQSLARIETSQALNVLAHFQGEPTRMELPMLVNQQMVNVQLSMQQQTSYDHDNSQQDGHPDQSYNILFSLELSQLGNIRVDANISDTTVHARIYNDNSDSSHFILDNIQRLENRLHQLGFKEVYLLASQQHPDAEKQQAFDQLEQMTPASLHLLDIRI